MEPQIIYETNDFLAINKPAGLVVHRAKVKEGRKRRSESEEPTLVDWLLTHRPEVKNVGDDPITRPGIVHRLDKATSGVMLVAKTQKYFEYLKALFQNHEIKKTYLAIVRGVPEPREGTIDAPIGIVSGTLKRSTRSAKMQKTAVTKYRVLKIFPVSHPSFPIPRFSLLEVAPLTGRTHQIRVHLASIGHPIAGDRLYGPKKQPPPTWASRLMLHAKAIEFAPAPGSHLKLEAEVPPEFSTGMPLGQ